MPPRGEVQERRRTRPDKYGRTHASPKDFVNFHVEVDSPSMVHGHDPWPMASVKSNSDAILMQFNRCKQEASACSSSVV